MEVDTKLFGTDGIRGTTDNEEAGELLLTPELIMRVSSALSNTLRADKFIICRDTRRSGSWIENSFVMSAGVECFLAGVLPTPAVPILAKVVGSRVGVSISASHNPPRYNGIKVFVDGFKMAKELEVEVENKIWNAKSSPGIAKKLEHSEEIYINYLLSKKSPSLKGLKLAVDCANGGMFKVAPWVFESLGARVSKFGCEPDGMNINEGCGTEHPENISVDDVDLAVLFDGDGDRVLFKDKDGVWDGDHIITLLGERLLKSRKLSGVVLTVMSNIAVERFFLEKGVEVFRVGVGDRNVAFKMKETNSNLGGEDSGHVILMDYSTTGDGLLTALCVLDVIAKEGKTLAELVPVRKYPQVRISLKVKKKPPLESLKVSKVVEEARRKFGRNGRVVVRYSGTEALLRVMVECEEEEEAKKIAEKIAECAQSEIGSED